MPCLPNLSVCIVSITCVSREQGQSFHTLLTSPEYSFLQTICLYIYFSGRDSTVESNKNASSLSQHFEVAFSFVLF